jgi:TRAP-type C4-dicarboxylate transport system permease small subunit
VKTLLTSFLALAIVGYGFLLIVGGPHRANRAAQRAGRVAMSLLWTLLKLPFTFAAAVLRRAWESKQQHTKW